MAVVIPAPSAAMDLRVCESVVVVEVLSVSYPSRRLALSIPSFHASQIWSWASQESTWRGSPLSIGCYPTMPVEAAPTGMEVSSMSTEEQSLLLPFKCHSYRHSGLHPPYATPICSWSPRHSLEVT
jgi:hypothetical protein